MPNFSEKNPIRIFGGRLTGPSNWSLAIPGWTILIGLVCAEILYAQTETDSKELTDREWALVDAIEQQRIRAIDSVSGSVVAIYGENRQGGGSGVLIHPSGIALTNHHVIMGAGVSGWGGIADGKLYHWKLIGTDPGGDVSLIQLEGKDAFPFTRLGNSDLVQIGDWALVMGNPFVLTEDQYPTVTLGIVSGVKRYQEGAGANQLVYGNCIQVDSSINPGNSGGPLFNFSSEVIGINGRGSFRDRGRVNVGLGYAISSNQIKNFIPDLLATKLVEHGTLDASFSERKGRIVCSMINKEAPVAALGLDIGDELIEFEGEFIKSANQFTNLICTLPADWPAQLKIRKPDQTVLTISTRLLGLPYPKPRAEGEEQEKEKEQPEREGGEEPHPAPEDEELQKQAMRKLLSAPAGQVRYADINRRYADQIVSEWKKQTEVLVPTENVSALNISDDLRADGQIVGSQELKLFTDGRFYIAWTLGGIETSYWYDGTEFFMKPGTGNQQSLTLVEAKLVLPIVQAMGMLAPNLDQPLKAFGNHLIDGSDKAQGQVAYRMLVEDQDQDKFFYWLNFEDEAGQPWYQLAKASAEKDLDDGGVIFANWKLLEDEQKLDTENQTRMFVPLQRRFVEGLAETKVLEIVNREAKWVSGSTKFPRPTR